MKKVIMAAIFAVTMVSCEKNEINSNVAVQKAFEAMYPDARGVEWEYKGGYSVADFDVDFRDVSVWFDSDAQWVMSEFDISYSSLPTAVKSSFETTEWTNWRDKDVERIERPMMDVLYVIEAESGEADIELRYSADGQLIESIVGDGLYDDNVDLLPEK